MKSKHPNVFICPNQAPFKIANADAAKNVNILKNKRKELEKKRKKRNYRRRKSRKSRKSRKLNKPRTRRWRRKKKRKNRRKKKIFRSRQVIPEYLAVYDLAS